MSERTREITGWAMPTEVNGEGWDRYMLVIREDGQMRMIHYEGVAYLVSEDRPWRWTDYAPVEAWSPEQLLAVTPWCREVNLADWVRCFGSRLESNFSQIVWWYNS